MKAIFLLFFLLLLFACSAPKKQSTVQEKKCLDYGPQIKVQLEGQLYEKSFPGPPNYFPQMSGHHRTEVLITVESLEKANE
jgi:hypothetical protein